MKPEQRRIVRVLTDDGPRQGVVIDGQVDALTGDVFGSWEVTERLGTLGSVSLLPPVVPSKIIGVGLNYRAHAAESSMEIPSEPLLFLKPRSAIIGPDARIVLPPQSNRVDYEAELAVVIGRSCRNVSADEAWIYVLGVTCGNDVTARDLQQRDDQWTRAKGFDTFCPLGPWVVTGLSEDTIGDLEVVSRVNGEMRQADRTSQMVFSVPELIAYASSIMTLEPGDVILSGTPEGVGPLNPGDVVHVEVENVGTLRNHVASDGGQRPNGS
jgi:2-keto-4-pentenoate hydratase/2-oxohepta-3-ene-1,7-dioic acid hydratase in catechol pathway